MSWNEELQKARKEFPDPLNDNRRLEHGLLKPLIEALGSVFTHYESKRKAGARDRVMTKAMDYHLEEAYKRQAKYIKNRRKERSKSNLRDLVLTLLFIVFFCLCIYYLPILGGMK